MRWLSWLVLSGALLGLLTGCAPAMSSAQLSGTEQGLYRAYRHLMTPGQRRTYLSLPSAAERAAYARQVGVVQTFIALPAVEQDAILRGQPFEGMSRQALYMLWGEPYRREGPEAYERWWYYGDLFSLAGGEGQSQHTHTVMEVLLENGRVQWWQERIPSDENRFPLRRLWRPPAD